MKIKLNRLFVIVFLAMTIGVTFGQEGINVIQNGEKGLAPRFLQIDSEKNISINNFRELLYGTLKIDEAFLFKEVNRETDKLGITHLKVQQYLNGYPVENAFFIFHLRNGIVYSANGEIFQNSSPEKGNLSVRSSISAEQALKNAKKFMGGNAFLWEKEKEKTNIGVLETLVYVCDGNHLDISKLKLAYKFDIYSKKPFDRKKVYIDTSNGNIVFAEDLKHSAFLNGSPTPCKDHNHHNGGDEVFIGGSTQTGFYGTKSIDISGAPGRYLASQTGNRNISITNLNGKNIGFSNTPPTGGAVISSNTPNGFGRSGNEGYYMAAYWGAQETWDMFKDDFGRNGYNGSGGKVNIFVNATGQNLTNNAFWVGSWTYFGNASSGSPFTPLDVVSHEIAHGVTQTSAGLVYRNESGAMNEGFSDIFGCYAEYYVFNRLDSNVWTLGENISFQRSLSNPKQHRQPDTYQGTNWYTGTGDNGGVHVNSGVLNHWFYILSQGKQGTNDKGSSYNVKGIGIEKAAQVAYRALTRYLTSSSNYVSARNAVISAATDLYGANSCELVATTNAMYAVGIGAKYSGSGCSTNNCDAVKGLSVTNVSESGARIGWGSVSSVTSYRLEYKKSSSSNYTQLSVNGVSTGLAGLSSDTSYQVRVTYTCEGKLAPYSNVVTFKTKDTVTPTCDAVTGVNSSNITKSSASISWNAKANINAYVLEYKTASSNSYTAMDVSSNSNVLNNLNTSTTYNVRIKYTCEGGGDEGCDGLDTYQTYPKIYYSGDRVTYNGRKYECNADGVYNIPPTGSVYSYLWNDLGACSGSVNSLRTDSPYSEVITFTTLTDDTPSCDAVSNVHASNITKTGAQITWSSVTGIEAYELQYKKASSGTYTSVNLLGTRYSIDSLEEATEYDVRVTYICSNGKKAPFSNIISFTTESSGGGCNGILDYQSGVFYQKGDKVIFNGSIWEAQITVWWSPTFGYWTNLGPCSNTNSSIFSYKVAPNPVTNNTLNINVKNEKGEQLKIEILDLSGNVLLKNNREASPFNSGNIKVDMAGIEEGVYIIYVNGISQKLIVK
ncbi:Por secretion system C-terminal sorting domain-containing protein [Tenacibaculum sp. MAR_2009_124]|uniref:M4 family metallopeptidase n=1 Tax=Tenacibaculum sp. MAR_2009_124 TaxID=1250059 RepID=UPI0008977A8E|nr:M4 family metallopeptidase [Tenacibaculum sp. MAR_2009_124]SEC39524.1 Por secretion system C-terminal sorting domain-containing protein [Tenacibaculum sp. MAR_2009_124]